MFQADAESAVGGLQIVQMAANCSSESRFHAVICSYAAIPIRIPPAAMHRDDEQPATASGDAFQTLSWGADTGLQTRVRDLAGRGGVSCSSRHPLAALGRVVRILDVCLPESLTLSASMGFR